MHGRRKLISKRKWEDSTNTCKHTYKYMYLHSTYMYMYRNLDKARYHSVYQWRIQKSGIGWTTCNAQSLLLENVYLLYIIYYSWGVNIDVGTGFFEVGWFKQSHSNYNFYTTQLAKPTITCAFLRIMYFGCAHFTRLHVASYACLKMIWQSQVKN